ncbi:MAG: 5'/3'-nucleotidase SurE [Bacteroidetes bacterium CG2_30_32_10]|nr:MAG: 5'/3'-nucleotidase SurE [Bacteroidetes bacterium CG2_30_32_10]
MEKPVILVVNDDGIAAPGIRCLINTMKQLGEVYVMAPDKPQSGMGHAITINEPLRITKISIDKEIVEYKCNGTPVDCVKLAMHKVLPHRPDLIVSGINHGSNSTISVIYSGTMAAAIEGAIEGIPAIGFSLLDYSLDADFSACPDFIKTITENVIKNGLPDGVCLNVNFPVLPKEQIKGIKVCRQAKAVWIEEFDERLDPHNQNYYWLTGYLKNNENAEDTDEWALENGFVTIVPTQIDLTSYNTIHLINNWKFDV